jgi:hypothetical protein
LSLLKALEDYLATKTTKGRTERHLGDLRSRLGRFVSDHPGKSLGDFGTPEVQRWLDRLKREDGNLVSPQTRRNFATVLGGMFEHFRRRGSIAENPCKDLERESVHGEGDIEFWKPEEVEELTGLRHRWTFQFNEEKHPCSGYPNKQAVEWWCGDDIPSDQVALAETRICRGPNPICSTHHTGPPEYNLIVLWAFNGCDS